MLLRHIPSDSGGSWSETFSPEHPTDLISGEKHNECTILDLIYVVRMWNSSLDLQEVFLSSSLVNEIITAIYFSGVAPRGRSPLKEQLARLGMTSWRTKNRGDFLLIYFSMLEDFKDPGIQYLV